MFEAQITRNEEVRAACAEKDIAVVYAPCGIGSNFITGDSAERLHAILAGLGEVTRHAELQSVPLITAGHSAGGIYCRNVAYWQPDRVAGLALLSTGARLPVSDMVFGAIDYAFDVSTPGWYQVELVGLGLGAVGVLLLFMARRKS